MGEIFHDAAFPEEGEPVTGVEAAAIWAGLIGASLAWSTAMIAVGYAWGSC